MKPFWCVFVLCLTAWSTSSAADEYLKFKQIHGQPLEARVNRYDLNEQTVTLTARDGREIVVGVAELSAPDKRLIAKSLERQLFQKPKANPKANHEANPAGIPGPRGGAAAQQPRGGAGGPIVWHANLKQASAQARGHETDQDDRPIVWFRVLGDLRGLM